VAAQLALAGQSGPPAPARPAVVGGCFVCFDGEDRAWAAAAVVGVGPAAPAVVAGWAGWPYEAGLLALREGPLLEAAVRSLPTRPDLLLVNATGRDHPRRCGLAVHLGAVLGVATAGVTHRPLLAAGAEPGPERGATSPLLLDGEEVGRWVRTRPGHRPLAATAGWGTTPATAAAAVLAAAAGRRTPEPVALARTAARTARARREPLPEPQVDVDVEG
jgi:deoxyribonuclease V